MAPWVGTHAGWHPVWAPTYDGTLGGHPRRMAPWVGTHEWTRPMWACPPPHEWTCHMWMISHTHTRVDAPHVGDHMQTRVDAQDVVISHPICAHVGLLNLPGSPSRPASSTQLALMSAGGAVTSRSAHRELGAQRRQGRERIAMQRNGACGSLEEGKRATSSGLHARSSAVLPTRETREPSLGVARHVMSCHVMSCHGMAWHGMARHSICDGTQQHY
eukprot:350869-Chlamydomonas_euryale.AAC.7